MLYVYVCKAVLTNIHINFFEEQKQESFRAHFAEGFHQGESNWEVRLIDLGVSVDDARWR